VYGQAAWLAAASVQQARWGRDGGRCGGGERATRGCTGGDGRLPMGGCAAIAERLQADVWVVVLEHGYDVRSVQVAGGHVRQTVQHP
jgi:hypothetical protein